MARRRFIEGGTVNLAIDFALQIGHFLGPLVHQQDDEDNLGMIFPNRFRDLFEQDGFSDPRRRDNQPTLTATERGQKVDRANAGRIRRVIFQT